MCGDSGYIELIISMYNAPLTIRLSDTELWRSGDRKIADTIPLTHGAQTTDYGGGTPIRVICKSLASPCVPVGRAGCTLLR